MSPCTKVTAVQRVREDLAEQREAVGIQSGAVAAICCRVDIHAVHKTADLVRWKPLLFLSSSLFSTLLQIIGFNSSFIIDTYYFGADELYYIQHIQSLRTC